MAQVFEIPTENRTAARHQARYPGTRPNRRRSATNTSLGQIVNARTLETQVSRLLSHPAAEVRELGRKLREAATGPAWCVSGQAGAALAQAIGELEASCQGTTSVVPNAAHKGSGL